MTGKKEKGAKLKTAIHPITKWMRKSNGRGGGTGGDCGGRAEIINNIRHS